MTAHYPGELAGDYSMSDGEIMITIRTTDGSPLTYQAAFDVARAVLEDAFETIEAPVAPITEEDIKNNPELN